jgi:hypothetical protein
MKPVESSTADKLEPVTGRNYVLIKVLRENEKGFGLERFYRKTELRKIYILNKGIYKSHLVIGLIVSSKLEKHSCLT